MKWPQQWTAQANVLGQTRGYRHFRVLGECGKGKERRLALEAVLNRAFRLEVPLVQLRDRSLWQPGWQSLSRPAS
ncbi:MAG: TIGR02450 family Trp-rich protein, partial [Vulcanococcus sp.]